MHKWYKLDNAGKIFPVLFNKNNTNGFRVSVLLKENIEADLLKEALNEAIKRFPMYKVRLKQGLFWFYFDENNKDMLIKEENPILFDSIRIYENNGYMFSVSYYLNKINLEMFHALSDGTGAMEFLKCITYYYLKNKGYDILNDGSIKTNEIEMNLEESKDSYIYNYSKHIKQYDKEERAFKIQSDMYKHNYTGLVQLNCSVLQFKESAKKYDLTITKYLVAKLLYTFYKVYFRDYLNKGFVKVFIPVNARKMFESDTLRNFALYIRTNYYMTEKELTFTDCVNHVNMTFESELTKEKILSRIAQNVKMEKNILVRCMPLLIKKQAMKIGYKVIGANANSLSISNLGSVSIPKSMQEYIDKFNFMIGVSKDTPINLGIVSFDDKMVISIATKVTDRKFIKEFVRSISCENDILIETNELECEL